MLFGSFFDERSVPAGLGSRDGGDAPLALERGCPFCCAHGEKEGKKGESLDGWRKAVGVSFAIIIVEEKSVEMPPR
jgi:hypothetical protein